MPEPRHTLIRFDLSVTEADLPPVEAVNTEDLPF